MPLGLITIIIIIIIITTIIVLFISFNWLTKGDLSIESEGFLCAAQEQALSTRAMMQVYSQGSSMCRLCGEHPENVEHLISGCSQLAGQQYKSRYDHVATGSFVRSTMLSVGPFGGSTLQWVS